VRAGRRLRIHLFPDRLTIINAGGLFGPVSVDRLGEEGISATRNQVLMKLLEDITAPDEGRLVCENRGSGISAMLSALRRAGLPEPHFVDRVATFEVTVRSLSPETRREPRARARGDRRNEILELLRAQGELTRAEIADGLGLGDAAARKWLRILRDEGRIELTTASEHSRNARYRLALADNMLLQHGK
jgi:ATP-dependent DNA helicase RecG